MAIAAADPAPAELITWERGSTTLPAAQTDAYGDEPERPGDLRSGTPGKGAANPHQIAQRRRGRFLADDPSHDVGAVGEGLQR
jgi:hypothetical protein